MLRRIATLGVLLLPLLALRVDAGAPTIEPADYEVKILVEPADEGRLVHALGKKAKRERRDVWFIDTPKLELFGRDVVLRARERDDELELTVKLRGTTVAFSAFTSYASRSAFEAAVDVTDGKLVRAVELGDVDGKSFEAKKPLARFTEEQIAFAESHALLVLKKLPLRAFGPIHTKVWQDEPKAVGEKVTVEVWPLPDGTRVVEISSKVRHESDVAGCEKTLDAFLAANGVRRAAVQGAKTKRALLAFPAKP